MKKWTEKEIQDLKKLNGKEINKQEIFTLFPSRTIDCVYHKAQDINVKYTIRKTLKNGWSESDDKTLIENYLLSKEILLNLFPSRTYEGVKNRMNTLELKRHMKNKWTKEENEILKLLYPKERQDILCKKLPIRCWEQIKIQASKLKIKRKYTEHLLCKLLEDTPETYYWIGFLLADGNFFNKKRIKFGLSIKDSQSVINFAKYINITQNISVTNNGSAIYASIKDDEYVPKICEKFDIDPRKTYNPPELHIKDKNLLMCLIIGYIDGDGCIAKHKKYNSYQISISLHNSWVNYPCLKAEACDSKQPPIGGCNHNFSCFIVRPTGRTPQA